MRPAAPSCAADASCAGQAYLETLIVLLVLLLCLLLGVILVMGGLVHALNDNSARSLDLVASEYP